MDIIVKADKHGKIVEIQRALIQELEMAITKEKKRHKRTRLLVCAQWILGALIAGILI